MRLWDKRVSIIIAMGSLVFASLVSAAPADVTNVHVERYTSGRYSFAVTVNHPDEGWDHYADTFEVLGVKGERLTRRILRHPHVDEQPFTRIRGGVRLPEALQAVTVRARCSIDGFVGKKVDVVLPTN
jgi:hypothetical protein